MSGEVILFVQFDDLKRKARFFSLRCYAFFTTLQACVLAGTELL